MRGGAFPAAHQQHILELTDICAVSIYMSSETIPRRARCAADCHDRPAGAASTERTPAIPSRDRTLLNDKLARAGIAADIADAALELDAILQAWRRKVDKRELGRRAIAELGLAIEMPMLDVLISIWAPSNEFGRSEQAETTVGSVAERLGIDPSRASRMVSAAIEAGYVKRDVSQVDARRAVLKLSDTGTAIVEAVRTYKFLLLCDFLNGWSAEELALFVPLLARFSSWSDASPRATPGSAEWLGLETDKLIGRLRDVGVTVREPAALD